MREKSALLIIDVQNDFCPGGALAVPLGDLVIEPLNRVAQQFADAGLPVLASRDWHPPTTRHFREFGGSWPAHCVQGSKGADFPSALLLPEGTMILSKGTTPELDGYSAFEGVTDDGMTLAQIVKELRVQRIYLGGLATDYCVLSTARDALRHGLEVAVLFDAVAGVDVQAGDSARAIEKMEAEGVGLITVEELLEKLNGKVD
ncbi:isochorismatase family protein [Pelotalea chapellei]|uniref:nicotinamidase n=1 Tax=Pelotalea chapellei TaxID=44671 RepID=A0ABS5U3I4_9BACT|nr:isochorismatase family protein [Pelotalea chapellei]MBT1070210.1 isochorismatase family protein [Pelotalea chapellei]